MNTSVCTPRQPLRKDYARTLTGKYSVFLAHSVDSLFPTPSLLQDIDMRAHSSAGMLISAVFAVSAIFAGLVSANPVKDISRPLKVQKRDQYCYGGVYIIYARGTFEPQNASLTNVVANAIVAAIPDSASMQVQYPANVSAVSPGLGIQDATKQITNYYNACPCSKMVLMGYSQGAYVIGNTIAGPNATATIPQSIGKNGEC